MELSEIDLLEDTWAKGVPHDQLTYLRHNAPVFWHEQPAEDGDGFWVVTKYDDIKTVSHDWETYSSERGGVFVKDATPEALATIRLTMLAMDPPKHHRYRKLVNRGFTPRMIRGLHDAVAGRARSIMDEVCEKGEIDFVEDVAVEMPAQVICDMLGVPAEDRAQIVEWTNTMVGFDDPFWQNTPEDGELAAAQIYGYCDELVEERRQAPTDDILSVLVHAEVDGERLSTEELNMFFVMLCVAGNETTRNLLSHSVQVLDQHRDQRRELIDGHDDDDLWRSATEEMLRWGCSIANFRRTVTRPTELRGVPIDEGQKLVTYYTSGNMDEDVFDDPFTFDVRRDPNEHITFGGGGVHYCLGANLARLEISEMMREFVTRCPDYELTDAPLRMRSDFIAGINRLPVSFSPSARTRS